MAKSLKTMVSRRLEELGRNPTDAARRGGLERTFLVDILNGRKRSVRGDNLAKLATALDWTPEEIVGDAATPAPRPATADDFERLKEACAAFLEAFSDTEGALQWIEELEAAILRPEAGPLPADLAEIRQIARAIAKSARFRAMQKKRAASKT